MKSRLQHTYYELKYAYFFIVVEDLFLKRFNILTQVTDETGTVVGLLNDTAKCYEGQQSGIGKMGECSKNNAKGYASLTGQPG